MRRDPSLDYPDISDVDSMNDSLELSEFPPRSREDWRERVLRVLNGRAFETLRTQAVDGIIIEPLYEPVSGSVIAAREAGEPWSILQRVDHPEPGAANELALDDMNNGATGLVLAFRGAPSARGFGLTHDASSIGMALKDIALHASELRLEAGAQGMAAAQAMREVVLARSLNPERINLSFGIDPIGALAAEGRLADAWSGVSSRLATLTQSLAQEFAGPFLEADGRVYHDGGGGEAQELGCVLAAAVCYLRVLDGKLDDVLVARAVGMTLAADSDMFMNIAKFRAARLLWSEMMKACGLPEVPLKLHGETSWRMMTRQDAHGNLLRHVAAVFAAGVGGTNSFSVLPHSLAAGLPDRFARRMARNAQSILIEESNLHRVIDPAAGSGYVDNLTKSLAEKAWEFFQDIEKHGGLVEGLQASFVQEKIRQSQHQRSQDIRTGKRAIIGVTTYANRPEASSILPIEPDQGREIAPMAIAAKRDAEEFETAAGE
jgi:methylmalonyl-CoA mutase